MDSVIPVVVEQECEELLPEQDLSDLSVEELKVVGGAMCDAGILEIDK